MRDHAGTCGNMRALCVCCERSVNGGIHQKVDHGRLYISSVFPDSVFTHGVFFLVVVFEKDDFRSVYFWGLWYVTLYVTFSRSLASTRLSI